MYLIILLVYKPTSVLCFHQLEVCKFKMFTVASLSEAKKVLELLPVQSFQI